MPVFEMLSKKKKLRPEDFPCDFDIKDNSLIQIKSR